MFSWIKNNKPETRKPSSTPVNTRIYAIGDIHGRFDLLQKLHELIKQDASSGAENIRKVIIYIGDYIDRGLESKQVIDSFINGSVEGFERIFILGNHEYAMLNFLDDPAAGDMWCAWGGDATVQSYGVNVYNTQGKRIETKALQEAFKAAFPDEHFRFLKSLKTSHVEGDYLFVHAGVRPEVPMEKQTDKDLMMIRDEFIASNYPMQDKTVVFGHTIFDEPSANNGKVAIDTGAYATGKLTAAVLEGTSLKFIST